MAVDVDLHARDLGLDGRDDVVGRLRLQQGGHVLDGQGVDADVSQLASLAHEAFDGVQRAGGVADRALGVLADPFHRGDRALDVTGVVQCVEDPEDVHAVLGRLLYEMVHDVVTVVAVAQQVLAAQKHLQTAVGHQRAERSQTLPGVFVQEPDAGVVGGATPALDAPVPGHVDILAGTDHVLGGHPGRHQGLVSVPKNELCDTDLSLRIHAYKYVAPSLIYLGGQTRLRTLSPPPRPYHGTSVARRGVGRS